MTSRPSLSSDRAAFRKACRRRYKAKADEGGNILCEHPGCDRWLANEPIPAHHLHAWAAGLGGRRKHDPEGLRFLCQDHHDEYEANQLCECRLSSPCTLKDCGGIYQNIVGTQLAGVETAAEADRLLAPNRRG